MEPQQPSELHVPAANPGRPQQPDASQPEFQYPAWDLVPPSAIINPRKIVR